ncbi:hypothetical protein Btru_077220 [Bulinus truncatus]|nr:hypothetical protein Btru_077220 [Bulinus truncatus]
MPRSSRIITPSDDYVTESYQRNGPWMMLKTIQMGSFTGQQTYQLHTRQDEDFDQDICPAIPTEETTVAENTVQTSTAKRIIGMERGKFSQKET